MAKRILVISPHPDDESIGCGGTLHKHVADGDSVRVIFLSSGEQGGHDIPPEETMAVREQEAQAATGILGIKDIEFWRQPDGGLRASRSLVLRVADTINKYQADLIYVPGEQEMHPDHKAASRIVRKAIPGCSHQPLVFIFEVWTPLAQIDEVVDITAHIDAKMSAIRAYESQCRVLGFDEAFLGLARYRGEMFCWPKPDENSGRYAEVFRKQTP